MPILCFPVCAALEVLNFVRELCTDPAGRDYERRRAGGAADRRLLCSLVSVSLGSVDLTRSFSEGVGVELESGSPLVGRRVPTLHAG